MSMMRLPKSTSGSRRSFLLLSAGVACTPLLRSQNKGQAAPRGLREPAVKSLQPKLVKEFKNAYLVAVSPDGGKMCLYFTKHPQLTFTFRGDQRTVDGGALKDEALGVIEMGSWDGIYSAQLRAKPISVSFFAGSEALYAETLPTSDSGFRYWQQVVIDLSARKLAERVSPGRVHESSMHFSALSRPLLVG